MLVECNVQLSDVDIAYVGKEQILIKKKIY